MIGWFDVGGVQGWCFVCFYCVFVKSKAALIGRLIGRMIDREIN